MVDTISPTIPGLHTIPFAGRQSGLLRFMASPITTLLTVYERFGLIGSMKEGDASVIFAFGAETNQQLLTDPKLYPNFAKFPYKVPENTSFSRNIKGLPVMNDDEHKRYRRLLMPAVSKQSLESYHDAMVGITDKFLQNWQINSDIDVVPEMKHLSLLIAMSCLLGLEGGDEEFAIGNLVGQLQKAMTSVATIMFPLALPGTSFSKMLSLSNAVENYFVGLIQKKRASGQDGRDMLSILMKAQDADGEGLTDEELQGHLVTIFVAGHDTVSHTLSWTLFLLTQHPEIYAAVVEELDSVLGGHPPTPAQLAELPMLDSVIKESMRLLPAVPFLVFRQNRSDIELGPYHVPEGSMIVMSPLITHRIEELYPQPKKFMPERWSKIKPNAFEYLPFSAGPRLCLGVGFANQELRIALALLLQRFKLSLAPNTTINARVESIVMGQRNKMWMHVDKQDRHFSAPHTVSGDIHRLVDLSH